MKRCGMKQRATLTAGIAILALLPTPSGATVLEFDESGAVSKKLSVNYIQRARLRENQANEKPSVITVPVVSSRPAELRINAPYNLEHIMNNIIYENASSFPSPSSAISSHTGSTPDAALDFVARLPSNAITYVEAARVRQPVRKSLARAAGWREQARLVARTHGLPPTLFIALIQAESGFNQEAVSPKGAIGFAQLSAAVRAFWYMAAGACRLQCRTDPRRQAGPHSQHR